MKNFTWCFKINTIGILLLSLLLYSCGKPEVIKIQEQIYDRILDPTTIKNYYHYNYYLMSNPPSDPIECHKFILKYVDDLGISLDSIKKTGLKHYAIEFYEYTLLEKMYYSFNHNYRYLYSVEDYLGGGVIINTHYEDSTKWTVYLSWVEEDGYYEPDRYRPYFLDLINEYNKNEVDEFDPRVQYYQALQEQKKKKP